MEWDLDLLQSNITCTVYIYIISPSPSHKYFFIIADKCYLVYVLIKQALALTWLSWLGPDQVLKHLSAIMKISNQFMAQACCHVAILIPHISILYSVGNYGHETNSAVACLNLNNNFNASLDVLHEKTNKWHPYSIHIFYSITELQKMHKSKKKIPGS